jgi:hypothetical protein
MTTRPIEDLRGVLAHRITFVLVNDRVPRARANCALCCARIERGYVRQPQTHLVYCDAQCFTEHDHARRVS